MTKFSQSGEKVHQKSVFIIDGQNQCGLEK